MKYHVYGVERVRPPLRTDVPIFIDTVESESIEGAEKAAKQWGDVIDGTYKELYIALDEGTFTPSREKLPSKINFLRWVAA